MIAILYVVCYVAMIIGASLYGRSLFVPSSPLIQVNHLIVVIFWGVNSLIALWEIVLYYHIDTIQKIYKKHLKKVPLGEFPHPIFMVADDISLFTALSGKYWANVWGTYSLLDVSYSQPGSFGYNIDVGNGFSTLLPSFAFIAVASGFPIYSFVSIRFFAFFVSLFSWQACYGTLVYFFQYVNNKRWEDHKTPYWEIVVLVGFSNVFWIIGPLFSLYYCWEMIQTNTIQVFL